VPFHVPVFAAVAENPFLARSPWRTPRFQPKRKDEQPCRPLPCASEPFSLRSTVPFNRDLRSSLDVFPHTWT
jgi:hypothetical protein